MLGARFPVICGILAVSTILLASAERSAMATAPSMESAAVAFAVPARLTTTALPNDHESSWAVLTLRGSPLIRGTSITARFAEGTVSGSAGCNVYWASYEAGDGKFSITSPIARTLMWCYPPAVMVQEDSYLSALKEALAYELQGDSLILLDEEGDDLIQLVPLLREDGR